MLTLGDRKWEEMSRVIGLVEALNLKGGTRSLHKAIYLCAKELFGYTQDEFKERWRPRDARDTGTLRGYTQPKAEALFDEWKLRRDPDWLYSHPEYKWDSVGVSVFQTSATTIGGVALLNKAGVTPTRAFDWGAGPGFSTMILAANFPKAEVHYNEINPDLVAIFEWFMQYSKLRNIVRVTQPQGPYDLVQAYEIVEHILHESRPAVGDPINPTLGILSHAVPGSHFLHSSCWSAENRYFTLGHFLRYDIDGEIVNNTRVGVHFRRAMARRGWEVAGTGWNSRPFLFKSS